MSPTPNRQPRDGPSWEAHKEVLRVMWLEQKMKLEQIMQFMSSRHGFHAEKWVYEAKLREWNFRKKLQRAPVDWTAIGTALGKRKLEGKESDVLYHGVLVPRKKVKREICRKRGTSSNDTRAAQELPPGVQVRTPKMATATPAARTCEGAPRPALLPKQGPDSVVMSSISTPSMLVDHCSSLTLDSFTNRSNVARRKPRPNVRSTGLKSVIWNSKSTTLPPWATRERLSLFQLPCLQFQSLLYNLSNSDTSKGPVRGLSSLPPGASAIQSLQQERRSASDLTAVIADVVSFIKRPGAGFELGEIVPEPLRSDILNISRAQTSLSNDTTTFLLAEIVFFLTANNLISGFDLIDLVQRVFDADKGRIFEKLFAQGSPTVLAFSSRILEMELSVALVRDNLQEFRTIVGLKSAQGLPGLNDVLKAIASMRKFDLMVELVQLGADLRTLDSSHRRHLLRHVLRGSLDQGLKTLIKLEVLSLEEAFKEIINLDVPSGCLLAKCFGKLEFLVEQGLDLNTPIPVKRDDGSLEYRTPFQVALRSTRYVPERIECLLNAGARINNTSCATSHTDLGEAVRLSKPGMVKLLLQKGADVKALANDQGMTLLELSANGGNDPQEFPGITDFYFDNVWLTPADVIGIFEMLLGAGADINSPSPRALKGQWNTALTAAIMNPHFKGPRGTNAIRLALARGANIHQLEGKMARTPLQAAATNHWCIDIAKELLNRGACVNAPAAPDTGRSALQAACEGGKRLAEIIFLLLDAGADVSAPPSPRFGRTALQALCTSGASCSRLMTLLIGKGADINAPPAEYGGITAIQGAAIAGNIKIVMLLIDMGAEINAAPSPSEGRMALDGAAEHGRLDTVQLLLAFGATCMKPGISGFDSAIKFAEENGHFVIADTLRGHWGGVGGNVFVPELVDLLEI